MPSGPKLLDCFLDMKLALNRISQVNIHKPVSKKLLIQCDINMSIGMLYYLTKLITPNGILSTISQST